MVSAGQRVKAQALQPLIFTVSWPLFQRRRVGATLPRPAALLISAGVWSACLYCSSLVAAVFFLRDFDDGCTSRKCVFET